MNDSLRWWSYGLILLVLGWLERLALLPLAAAAPVLTLLPPLILADRAPPAAALAAWWLAGLVRDAMTEGRLGVNALIFLLMGACLLLIRPRLKTGHTFARLILAVAAVGVLRLTEYVVLRSTGRLPLDGFLGMIPAACLLTAGCGFALSLVGRRASRAA